MALTYSQIYLIVTGMTADVGMRMTRLAKGDFFFRHIDYVFAKILNFGILVNCCAPRLLLAAMMWPITQNILDGFITWSCLIQTIPIGRTCWHGYLDHFQATTGPVTQVDATLDPVAASNAFSCNFANNGHRNSIQLSNFRAMCWKSHFWNHFQ